jgi:hypothetical protein
MCSNELDSIGNGVSIRQSLARPAYPERDIRNNGTPPQKPIYQVMASAIDYAR